MADPPPLPLHPVAEYRAPGAWRAIDLLSDVHLSPAMPATFDAWASHLLNTDADAVFMLGDLFEAWVGDDARHEAFEARCFEVMKNAAVRRQLAFLPGNRDFLLGITALRDASIELLSDPTVLLAFDKRWLLTHGDALCLADVDYQRFRAEVRSDRWQQAFLSLRLGDRRRIARELRDGSERRQQQLDRTEYADVDKAAALSWMSAVDAPVMIHGHTHQPGTELLGPGRARHVLSDWDFDHVPARADVLRLDAAGLHRFSPITTP